MMDADVELRLRRWLATDAATVAAPASLRARVLRIPAVQPTKSAWWSRFAPIPALTGAVAAATVAAFVLSGTFFTTFDRPPGTDGGLCNNRQLQRALDELRDTDGYRYLDTQQNQVLASDPETALEDPVFEWADALTSDVAYLAPDRTREVVTPIDQVDRGYLEQVRIGDQHWQLREIEGEQVWIRIEPWPFGNWAYGYVQNAMGLLGLPGIASIRFGAEPVPDGLTGQGGCTIAAPGEVETRIVALRVGEDGRVSDIYLGPPAGAPGNRDAYRNLIQMEYTLPSPEEFVPPAEFVDEDDPGLYPGAEQPPPSPMGTLAPRENGWAPTELPLGGAEVVGAYVSDVLAVDGRWVAVGSSYDADNALQGFVWTSTDGVRWDLVPSPPEFAGMSFAALAWDGATYLAVAYRTLEPAEDGSAPLDRPESWLSSDGMTWEPGGMFEAGANPSGPISTDHGWVAGGSIWNGTAQRPAFFSSADGVTWVTHQPEEIAYGYVGVPVLEPDGSLSATSCETPEETNTAAGSPCFEREWTSEDGVTWTPGAVVEDDGAVSTFEVPAGDGFLALRHDPGTGLQGLYRSDDGTTWEPVPLLMESVWYNVLLEIPDGLLLIGQRMDTMNVIAVVWRSVDGGQTWDELPLSVPAGSVGLSADQVTWGDHGLTIFGAVYVDEVTGVPVVWVEP
jgi:hypothetical protein